MELAFIGWKGNVQVVNGLPDFERTSHLFVGEVKEVEPEPRTVHGRTTQSVTYINIEIIFGRESWSRGRAFVFYPVSKDGHGLPPEVAKIGTKLIVGTDSDLTSNYVHRSDQETLQSIHKALPAFVQKLVNSFLDDHHFDLTLATNDDEAFLDGRLLTLPEIANAADVPVHDRTGKIAEARDLMSYVRNYYQKKKKDQEEKEKKEPFWELIVQLGYAPQVPFWASRPQPPGTLMRWQNNAQGSLGLQHGQLGWNHTLQLSGTIGDSKPFFENALLSYQLAFTKMLGNPIDASGAAETWSYLTGSVFTQVGLGIGNNQPSDRNQIQIGLAAQVQTGGQLTLNIWKVQVFSQGALVYSYLSGPGNNRGQGSSLGAALMGGLQGNF